MNDDLDFIIHGEGSGIKTTECIHGSGSGISDGYEFADDYEPVIEGGGDG